MRKALALMALAVAACGSPAGDDDDDGQNPTPTPLSSAQTQKVGGSIASGAEFGAKSYDLRANPAFAFVCPDVTTFGDSDGDGIDDIAALEYTNCPVNSPWGPATLNGDAAIQDTQPNVPGVDASLAQDFVFAVTGTAGLLVDFSAVQELSQSGDAFLFNEPSVVEETAPGYLFRQENAWVKRYDPASAWTPGDALVAGTYELAGAFQHRLEENGVVTYALEGAIETQTPLQLDPACPSLVVAGTLHAIIGDESTGYQILQITWTGCDASGTELIPTP